MLSIRTIIEVIKEVNDLDTDTDVAELLEVSNLSPYLGSNPSRVFKGDKVSRLSEVSGFKRQLIEVALEGARAKKNNDKQSVKSWNKTFKVLMNSAAMLVILLMVSLTTPSSANQVKFVQKSHSEAPIMRSDKIYIMLSLMLIGLFFFI